MTTTLVELAAVTKDFKGHRATDALSLAFKSGSTVGLLGPNGAGKTSCLKMGSSRTRVGNCGSPSPTFPCVSRRNRPSFASKDLSRCADGETQATPGHLPLPRFWPPN